MLSWPVVWVERGYGPRRAGILSLEPRAASRVRVVVRVMLRIGLRERKDGWWLYRRKMLRLRGLGLLRQRRRRSRRGRGGLVVLLLLLLLLLLL